MQKQWDILQPDIHTVKNLCRVLKCSPVTASILVNRKISSPEDALRFLNPSLSGLRSPLFFKDMDAAVRRISDAIIRHEKILIFGDYDVDGITAAAILLEFFRYVDADVSYYIPHRVEEGYSLKASHISDFAMVNRVNLIITVDCGSASYNAVKAAKDEEIDIIITDHHIAADNLPQAVAVVNPNRYDCDSGFNNLAGVGVAFYLLICLRTHLRDMNFWIKKPEPNLKSMCDFVALGTTADMVPLVEENRILLRTGLDIINSRQRPGINALIDVSGLSDQYIEAHDIAFRLAPRLNAAGRMGDASIAVELLTTTDIETARQIAHSLDDMNMERRDVENEIHTEIQGTLNRNPHLLSKRTLVLSCKGWHEGVLGIVASRFAKIYFRPVVLIAIKNGFGKGSARSIPGVDLYQGLMACKDCLENFGGHSMAAGLKIQTEKIDLFGGKFEDAVCKMTSPDDFVEKILIDYELDLDGISDKLIDELESLKPFGSGNPEPLFSARNIKVLTSSLVGENHRRMVLSLPSDSTGKTINAIQFNVDTRFPFKKDLDQIAFRLRWNRWAGKKTIQMVIEESC
ncbi:single-stranded-DNA-specific exonuclease RecJ [Thermodesulfobacteriota bacterium]